MSNTEVYYWYCDICGTGFTTDEPYKDDYPKCPQCGYDDEVDNGELCLHCGAIGKYVEHDSGLCKKCQIETQRTFDACIEQFSQVQKEWIEAYVRTEW